MPREEIDAPELEFIGQGHHGDKTTTGTDCYSSLQNAFWIGVPAPLLKGNRTRIYPACGKRGVTGEGTQKRQFGAHTERRSSVTVLTAQTD